VCSVQRLDHPIRLQIDTEDYETEEFFGVSLFKQVKCVGMRVRARMKDVELKLVCELIKNSRRSDRELAKLIGVSQPTITRTGKKLEQKGFIRYTAVPNLAEMGFEIIAIIFANWKREEYPDTRVPKARDFIKRHPNIVFVSTRRGLDSDRVAMSVHKSYSDYAKFMAEIRTEWAEYMTIPGSFLISIGTDNVLRPLSFSYLADCLFGQKPE